MGGQPTLIVGMEYMNSKRGAQKLQQVTETDLCARKSSKRTVQKKLTKNGNRQKENSPFKERREWIDGQVEYLYREKKQHAN